MGKYLQITNNGVYPFSDALYKAQCPFCRKYSLEWEMVFDPDSPSYHADCCGYRFYMTPVNMEITFEKGSE